MRPFSVPPFTTAPILLYSQAICNLGGRGVTTLGFTPRYPMGNAFTFPGFFPGWLTAA